MKRHLIAALVATSAITTSAFAHTNDSDLSPPTSTKSIKAPLSGVLAPDSQNVATIESDKLSLTILRRDHGALKPVTGLKFVIPGVTGRPQSEVTTDAHGQALFTQCLTTAASSQAGTLAVAKLDNAHFRIVNNGTLYSLSQPVECGKSYELTYETDTAGGQALGIWMIASLAKAKLEQAVGLKFWASKIHFQWPGTADFYSWGTVNITLGHQWDVVGHELGHAIYDQANIGGSAGGPHKIDECYSETLALSEGWASYFSAWLSVELSDSDAKFEYMVPRRAPIRFEQIPTDVCNGPKNEWRVTGFFWDLIDLVSDGEDSQEAFARVWNALANTTVDNAGEAFARLERSGFDRGLLTLVWSLNFRTPLTQF